LFSALPHFTANKWRAAKDEKFASIGCIIFRQLFFQAYCQRRISLKYDTDVVERRFKEKSHSYRGPAINKVIEQANGTFAFKVFKKKMTFNHAILFFASKKTYFEDNCGFVRKDSESI